MKYRKRHLLAALLSAFTLFSGQALAMSVDNLMQVVAKDSATGKTISWQSDSDRSDYSVEYRHKDQDDVQLAYVTEGKRPPIYDADNPAPYTYGAYMQKLTPATEYEYRIVNADGATDWITFSTTKEDLNQYKVLVFGDSQSTDYSVWGQTAQIAWQQNDDAAFFINMGDLVDNGQDYYQWNAWFDVVGDMIARIPVVPLLGNHETYDKDWKVRMPEAYLHLFALPRIDREKYQNQFYSFDYGDVHFVVLNTQSQELADFEPSLDEDEVAWFKEDMAKTTKKWKIVLMHKDPLQYGFANRPQPREEGFSPEGRLWMPLFDQYGVDAVLSAHLHTYRDRGHIRNFQRDESGPLYLITGVAGNVQYPGLWKQHSLDKYVAPQPETDNYMTLEATDDSLTFRSFLPDGQLLEEKSISSHK